MKKILHLTTYLDTGGLERMILLLCREQKKGGEFDPLVVAYERATGDLLADFKALAVQVSFLNKGAGFSPLLPFRIARIAQANRVRLIHTHDLGALIYASLAKFLSAGRLKIVHTQHSFQHLNGVKARLYERIFPRFASRVACVSGSILSGYSKLGMRGEKFSLLPNGVDFGEGRRNSAGREALRMALLKKHRLAENLLERKWVIYIGRLAKVKGVEQLAAIWDKVPAAAKNKTALFLIGPEAEPEVSASLSARAGSGFLLAGPTREPASWLQAADLFVSASTFEGLPMAGLEAAAAACPMLLSEIPGHQLFKGWAAFFPDGAAGAAKLSAFCESGKFAGEGGDREVLARLERENNTAGMAAQYAEIYRSLLESN